MTRKIISLVMASAMIATLFTQPATAGQPKMPSLPRAIASAGGMHTASIKDAKPGEQKKKAKQPKEAKKVEPSKPYRIEIDGVCSDECLTAEEATAQAQRAELMYPGLVRTIRCKQACGKK